MKKRILISASLFHALTDAATIVTPTIFPILYSQAFLIKNIRPLAYFPISG